MIILLGLTSLRQYHSSRPKACGCGRETETEKTPRGEKKKKSSSVPWESGVNSVIPNEAGEH